MDMKVWDNCPSQDHSGQQCRKVLNVHFQGVITQQPQSTPLPSSCSSSYMPIQHKQKNFVCVCMCGHAHRLQICKSNEKTIISELHNHFQATDPNFIMDLCYLLTCSLQLDMHQWHATLSPGDNNSLTCAAFWSQLVGLPKLVGISTALPDKAGVRLLLHGSVFYPSVFLSLEIMVYKSNDSCTSTQDHSQPPHGNLQEECNLYLLETIFNNTDSVFNISSDNENKDSSLI